MPSPPFIEIESPGDAAAVDGLVLAAFGPGRHAKTAERLRESATFAAGFTVHAGGRLVGSVRLWEITVGDTPALFLGPIAVAAAARGRGLGAELVRACIAMARGRGHGVLLVGDLAYFANLGFQSAPKVRMAGPVDPARLLWLGPSEPNGLIQPA